MSIDVQDLHEFHGWPPALINIYLHDRGWEIVDCFNDYKYAWVNYSLNKSIVVKIDMVDNDSLGNEMITDVWSYDGIYSDKWEDKK
jgi:hypothetical protein